MFMGDTFGTRNVVYVDPIHGDMIAYIYIIT